MAVGHCDLGAEPAVLGADVAQLRFKSKLGADSVCIYIHVGVQIHCTYICTTEYYRDRVAL